MGAEVGAGARAQAQSADVHMPRMSKTVFTLAVQLLGSIALEGKKQESGERTKVT